MRFKQGVKLDGIQYGGLSILLAAEQVYNKHGLDCVVTSVLDGKHMHNSKHYIGEAVDLRLASHPYYGLGRFIDGDYQPTAEAYRLNETLLTELKAKLGFDFDCIEESDHFHLEYDPGKQRTLRVS